jgi:hypothetical protein
MLLIGAELVVLDWRLFPRRGKRQSGYESEPHLS